jgi:GntR family transcriptional regulator, transcriptional repressor for pyruvate dehydrogenase complex
MLRAVEKKRAYQDVVNQIVNLIQKGKLKKEDQLPSERELTEAFKVSRTTVREAIRCLESMRLVESRQGNGTFVLASSRDVSIQSLSAALFHEKDDLQDIFYIRKIIEPFIAQLAAEYATAEEVEQLAAMVKAHEENLASGADTVDLDTAFHMALARSAKNRVMSRLVQALIDLLAESRKGVLQSDRRAVESLRGHKMILDAVKNGDCLRAREAMRRHLLGIEKLLFKGKKGGGRCR